MKKDLLIEVGDYSTDLNLCDIDVNEEIDFSEYEEELSSTYSGIYLYEVNENYFEEEDESKKELVATLYGRYFDIGYAYDYGKDLRYIFEDVDADTSTLIPFLLDDSGDIKDEFYCMSPNIYYLDRIEVEDKYKGKGYAKFLLKNLEGILTYVAKLNLGIIIIQAQPYDRIDGKSVMDYEDKKRMERLIKLYEGAGFKRIGKTNYLISVIE